jgi:hypothetical protein
MAISSSGAPTILRRLHRVEARSPRWAPTGTARSNRTAAATTPSVAAVVMVSTVKTCGVLAYGDLSYGELRRWQLARWLCVLNGQYIICVPNHTNNESIY